MRSNKIGAIFIVSAMALAGVGASYAVWFETITVAGTINTGNVDIDWSTHNVGTSEPPGYNVIQVSEGLSNNNDLLTITITNAYPCIDCWATFDITCVGSIPVHFPDGWDITYGSGFNPLWITYLGPDTGYGPIKTVTLQQGQSWNGKINIRLDNTASQGATYTFTISIEGMQYNECEPHTGGKIVNLPPGVVTAIFHNPGPQSYWQTALSNVPGGYDVANGLYVGWCVNEHTYIVPGLPYTIHLMSSYDAGNPWPGNHGWYDWPCVNWIINNKDGYTPGQIQDAIWYFVDGGVDPGGGPTHILIQAALANGQYFAPSSGQHVAVLCIGDPIHQNGYDVQHTFIEVDP